MATRIKPKRSETSSSVPTTSNLAVGEIAINSADQKIYTRDSNDNIVTLAQPGLLNVVEDTTPQLGGSLDTNSNDINFADNDKAIFGAGNDLQIYHDGSLSYIVDDSSTGDLRIESNFLRLIDRDNNATTATFDSSGVNLRHNDAVKLTTTSTGILTCGSSTITDGTISWPFASKSDNLHIGTDASCSLTTGANNIAVGCQSLKLNEDGSNNIAIGQNSLCCATTPSTNIVIGKNSLCASDECTFVARWNGSSYPTVTCSTTKNIVIGNDLLSNEIMSSYNTVIGNDIATCASSCVFSWGCTCTCNGQSAIPYDEYNSYNNTLIGNCIAPFAGRLDKSVVLGSNIAFSTSNTCPIICSQIFGYNILNCAQTDCGGNGEVIRSFLAGSDMFKDTPMYEINRTIAIGNEIGVTGTYNCRRTEFIRQQCSVLLGDYVSQFGNSFSAVSIGACSTKTLYTNNNSVFIGASAGDGDGTSNNTRCTLNLQNVAIGSFAMGQIGYNNTTTPSLTIRDNTTVGYASLYSVSGNYNTALGSLSGYCITTGDCNTTIGTNSGFGITTGSCNTFIGESSGCTLTTGNNNIIIGHNTQPSSNTVSNETSIGGSCLRFPGISSTSGQVLCYNGTHWVAGAVSSSYGVDGSTSGTSIYISDTSCSFTTGTGNTIVGESTGCSIKIGRAHV